MKCERTPQVVPGLVKLPPGGSVEHIFNEKVVVSMVFDSSVECVALGIVVGGVEGARDRIPIGGGRLPLGDLRKQPGEFENSPFPVEKGRTVGVGEQRGDRFSLVGLLELGDRTSDDAVFAVLEIELC